MNWDITPKAYTQHECWFLVLYIAPKASSSISPRPLEFGQVIGIKSFGHYRALQLKGVACRSLSTRIWEIESRMELDGVNVGAKFIWLWYCFFLLQPLSKACGSQLAVPDLQHPPEEIPSSWPLSSSPSPLGPGTTPRPL